MTTKYILAGGLDRAHPEYWDNLGKELDIEKPIRLLSCFFSQPKDDWKDKFKGFEPFFKRAFGDDVVCMLAGVEDFLEQVKKCDVLYLHGGSSHRLKSVLIHYGDLKPHFKDKVVIGSSAGANYLSKIGWSPSLHEPIQGSGTVPLNVVVHYGSTFADEDTLGAVDWGKAQEQVQNLAGKDETVTLLREGKFVVIEQ